MALRLCPYRQGSFWICYSKATLETLTLCFIMVNGCRDQLACIYVTTKMNGQRPIRNCGPFTHHLRAGWLDPLFKEVELETGSEWSGQIKSRTLFLWKSLKLLQSDGSYAEGPDFSQPIGTSPESRARATIRAMQDLVSISVQLGKFTGRGQLSELQRDRCI